MPTLLDVERAFRATFLEPENGDAAEHVIADGISPDERLDIYRNTFIAALTKALRLNFPAVLRLVGDEFLDAAARIFIEAHPPKSAWLDAYGGEFSAFLAAFPASSSLTYLADVARLEWAVASAFHAPERTALDLGRMSNIPPEDHGRLRFVPDPSLSLVPVDHPADEIWQAVLDEDDAAMAAIDLSAGSRWLQVRRLDAGVDVTRLDEADALFLSELCEGVRLEDALETSPDIDAPTVLARFLADGLFVDIQQQGAVQ